LQINRSFLVGRAEVHKAEKKDFGGKRSVFGGYFNSQEQGR
jgi:hypothetical protein